jgi:hypothetical protein
MVGGLIALFLGFALTDAGDFKRTQTETEIVSLQGNTSTEGAFFLGTGSFGGRKAYYYYVETKRGAINQKVYANETFVKEKKGANPRIIRLRHESNIWQFHFPVRSPESVGLRPEFTQIIVPKGSIKNEFNPN